MSTEDGGRCLPRAPMGGRDATVNASVLPSLPIPYFPAPELRVAWKADPGKESWEDRSFKKASLAAPSLEKMEKLGVAIWFSTVQGDGPFSNNTCYQKESHRLLWGSLRRSWLVNAGAVTV